MTYEITKNEDEIQLEDDSDDSDDTKNDIPVSKKFSLSLPPPKNDTTTGEELNAKRSVDEIVDKTEEVKEGANDDEQKSPQKKVLKRRNLAIYASNEETE